MKTSQLVSFWRAFGFGFISILLLISSSSAFDLPRNLVKAHVAPDPYNPGNVIATCAFGNGYFEPSSNKNIYVSFYAKIRLEKKPNTTVITKENVLSICNAVLAVKEETGTSDLAVRNNWKTDEFESLILAKSYTDFSRVSNDEVVSNFGQDYCTSQHSKHPAQADVIGSVCYELERRRANRASTQNSSRGPNAEAPLAAQPPQANNLQMTGGSSAGSIGAVQQPVARTDSPQNTTARQQQSGATSNGTSAATPQSATLFGELTVGQGKLLYWMSLNTQGSGNSTKVPNGCSMQVGSRVNTVNGCGIVLVSCAGSTQVPNARKVIATSNNVTGQELKDACIKACDRRPNAERACTQTIGRLLPQPPAH